MLWNTRDENQRRELLRLANLPHVWHARAWLSFTHRERLRLFQAMTRVECDRSVDLGLCL